MVAAVNAQREWILPRVRTALSSVGRIELRFIKDTANKEKLSLTVFGFFLTFLCQHILVRARSDLSDVSHNGSEALDFVFGFT